MVGSKAFIHRRLVNCAKLKLMLCCDQHWTFVDKRSCSLIFYIMSSIAPLGEHLPVRNVQGVLFCLINEDDFCKLVYHSFVKSSLLSHSCNIAVVNEPLDWEE